MDVLPDAGEADRGFIGGMPAYGFGAEAEAVHCSGSRLSG